MKNKKTKQEVKISSVTSNKKVDEIVADYPEKLIAYPRTQFEHQFNKQKDF